ncbi:MAG: response regulator [Bacteroidales bacterium]|nr:response regulator [Bacteroidales bacterium]MBN2757010.1 response regulator [Bacteroidales bacterium]
MKYNILVVDDDRFVHMYIENAIETEHHDYRILSAYNGKEACEIAQEQELDLIIMDWEMPVMNGIQALENLKNDPLTADIPVIMITSSGNLQTAFDVGAIDFLRKPIDRIELLVRVKSTLSMFKLIKNIVKQTEELEEQSAELEQKNKKLEEERKKSDDLLLNILPYEIAEQLKNKGAVDAKTYRRVSVLFTDFKGFTNISEQLSPQEIIKELSIFFAKFDEIIGGHFIEKIKTIGDAYMCVGGLPLRNKSNPIDTVLAGLKMQLFVNEINKVKIEAGLSPWFLRLGIHTGKVVAGVIGKKKFAYDIWGDTVNTASRMESAGEIGKVNISGDTYEYVKEYFECEYRGKVEAKNKGEIDMYFVHCLKPEYSMPDSNIIPNKNFLEILSEY